MSHFDLLLIDSCLNTHFSASGRWSWTDRDLCSWHIGSVHWPRPLHM